MGEGSYSKSCQEIFGHGRGEGKNRTGFLKHDIVVEMEILVCLVGIGV